MNNIIWNHNLAYNKWIKKHLKNKQKILDVGCGNGYLDFYLNDGTRLITGIDLKIPKLKKSDKNITFIQEDFMKYDFKKEKYDAIIFVASIHHMDHEKSLEKAKKLLNKKGVILIVGLSKPTSIMDWIVEILRIIPSKIISKINKIQTSEELNINVCYDLPSLGNLKKIFKHVIPGYKLRYGLHYRYLLFWEKH